MKKNLGFTVIELIIVIAIIAVLTTIVSMRVSIYIQKSKQARVIADFKKFEEAVNLFYAKYGGYPCDGDECYFSPTHENGTTPFLEVNGERRYLSEFLSLDFNKEKNASYYEKDSYYEWEFEERQVVDCMRVNLRNRTSEPFVWKYVICSGCPTYCEDAFPDWMK